jgi:hypothetical protein
MFANTEGSVTIQTPMLIPVLTTLLLLAFSGAEIGTLSFANERVVMFYIAVTDNH